MHPTVSWAGSEFLFSLPVLERNNLSVLAHLTLSREVSYHVVSAPWTHAIPLYEMDYGSLQSNETYCLNKTLKYSHDIKTNIWCNLGHGNGAACWLLESSHIYCILYISGHTHTNFFIDFRVRNVLILTVFWDFHTF